ncbi:hypothetical protein MHU86_8743 [Fragilaria crotonensis]|nr:hypothetical protein MHU86_8743 [Fragilaria crotonensis]
MMGFFTQLGTSVPLYNISLNAFFLATVVYRVSELKFQKNFEPYLHAMSILFPLITASVGAGISLYSEKELGLVCWIGHYPEGCGEDPSVPCLDPIFALIFGGIPLGASIIFLLVSNGMIYWKVRSTGRRSEQYRRTKFETIVNDSAERTGVTNRSSISSPTSHGGVQPSDAESGNSSGYARRSREFLRTLLTFRNNTSSASDTALRCASREHEQARAVAIQATLYVLACLTSLMVLVAIAIQQSAGIQREQESDFYWLTVLIGFIFPLQGFLNVLIYLRPRYMQWRRLLPMRSRLWALKQCLTNKIPPSEARRARSRESQFLGCHEPAMVASDSLADLQPNIAVCAGDNREDAI